MKQILLSLFTLTSIFCFSQKTETTYLDYSFKEKRKKKAFYVQTVISSDDKIEKQITFKKSGVLLKKIETDKNTKISKETVYWNKGGKRKVFEYKNSELHGLYTIYYWNGSKKVEYIYSKGLKDGASKSYNHNSELKSENIYVNDKLEGESKLYNKKDSSITKVNYINNKKQGPCVERDYKGNILDSTYFVSGKIKGKSFSYYKNGSLKTVKTYKNGKLDGEQKNYHENGEISSINSYKNGKSIELENSSDDLEEVMVVVEKHPEYPGGNSKLFEYLGKNIKYPQAARMLGVKGKVYIQFVVEKDGSLSSLDVVRGIGSGCDEVALKAIEDMPKWSPGEQRGKAVRVRFILPVNFSLR
jgi:TonB family protein